MRTIHASLAAASAGERNLAAVGIGTPGEIDPDAGAVLLAANVPGFTDRVELGPLVAEQLSGAVPVKVDNDVRVGVLVCRGGRRWGSLAGSAGPEHLHGTTTLAPGASRVVLTRLCMGSAAGLGLWREIVALPRFWAGAIASFDDAWHANSGPDREAGRAMHEECAQRARARIWRRCWRAVHHPRDTLDTLPAHSRQKPRVRSRSTAGSGDPPPPSPPPSLPPFTEPPAKQGCRRAAPLRAARTPPNL